MKLFITGATGFLGRYVVRAAVGAGHECFCIHRSEVPVVLQELDNVTWLSGGLRDDWSSVLADCDVLMHLASAGVSPQKATREQYFQTNVTDSLLLVESAVDCGVRHVIACGSCFEYGASGERYDLIPVDAPLEPINAYGASKAAASLALCALSREKGFCLTILRPFHFYGEGQASVNLWPSLRAAALAGHDFEMTAGEQVRDYMPVEEVAAAFVKELQQVKTDACTVIRNVGTGQPITLRSFCEFWWHKWSASGALKVGSRPYPSGEVMCYVPEI